MNNSLKLYVSRLYLITDKDKNQDLMQDK